MAKEDSNVRSIAESKIPYIVERCKGEVRFNAVKLAENLTLEEVVPQLVHMLKDPMTIGGATSFGIHARSKDDPPGARFSSDRQSSNLFS